MKVITKIIFFENTNETGLDKLDAGTQFAVNNNGEINFYMLKNANLIDANTTVQQAIDNGYIEKIRSGFVEPTLNIYEPGVLFHKNELFTEATKSKFYVATQDFTANGDIETDINNGNVKNIGGSEYSQIQATVNSGDILVIPLTSTNNSYNKHCFIEAQQAAQNGVNVILSDFEITDTKWNFDDNWVTEDGTIHLKNTRIYEPSSYSNNNITMYIKTVNTDDYADIAYIGASAT